MALPTTRHGILDNSRGWGDPLPTGLFPRGETTRAATILIGDCASVADPGMFFPATGGVSDAPIRICNGCPIKVECLEYALSFPESEDYGIWGGTSAIERRRIRARIKAQQEGPQWQQYSAPQSSVMDNTHGEAATASE